MRLDGARVGRAALSLHFAAREVLTERRKINQLEMEELHRLPFVSPSNRTENEVDLEGEEEGRRHRVRDRRMLG